MDDRVNVRMTVAYDGTGFRGLAANDGVRTVVGELQRVLEPLLGEIPNIVMSGRTDAGVHAWGQVLSFAMPQRGHGLERIQRSINSRLGPEIVVRHIDVAPDDFSARFSATGRRYRYHVLNGSTQDPFLAATAWWVDKPLNLEQMSEACPFLVGEHDFSSFCRRPKPQLSDNGDVVEASLVRRVTGARWRELDYLDDSVETDGGQMSDPSGNVAGRLLRFEIEGSAFCHQMVRSIVGFMVAVGTGKRASIELPDVLAARDRSVAENPAPPHGLTLWEVDYQ